MSEKKTYSCTHCLKVFTQKNDYTRHINKKYPCVTKDQIKDLKNEELIELKEKMSETDALKFLESFFNKIKDLLRDQESITSDRALDVITDFLFLRLLNYELETNNEMDFISQTYNKKIKINNYDCDIDEFKKYFKWNELMELINLIDKDSSNQENKQLLVDVITHIIFGGIFKYNENTKEIYKNRRFFVKKFTTIQRLLKEFNKIDFTKYNVDIKGKAYEMTLQKESVTNSSFGQYFTPTCIDKYMVSNVKIKINKDGSYTKILDPACGTAGILTEYYAEVKRRADKEKIKLDKDVSKYIYGCEIVDDTLKLAQMNMLLKSNSYNTNLKNVDFLEVECLDYDDEKLDANIIMNPPFALTKKYHLFDDDVLKKIFYGQTKSGTMLFLMAGLNSISDGNQLIMVSPNGKEIFSKNKEFMNIRKKTMEIANIFKIAILPDASFKPYTSVQTLILMMEKGTKTDKIEFVKLEKNKDDTFKEIKLCLVEFKEIEKKNYSWNYKEYYIEKGIEYKNLKYEKIESICEIFLSGKRNSSEGKEFGKYPLFYCSILGNLFLDEHDFDEENIVINSTNGSGKCQVYYWNGKFSTAQNTIRFKSKVDYVLTKFIFYYLKINKNILEEKFFGMNQKKITGDDLKLIKIPIPPLEIQNLIVKELDSYYKIKDSNQNVLDEFETQRIGKFELLISLCKNTEKIKLGLMTNIKTGKNKPSDGVGEGKKYPYYGTGGITGYTDEFLVDGEYLLTPRNGTIGNITFCSGKSFPSDHMFIIKVCEDANINIKFLNYSLLGNNLSFHKTGSTIPNITKEILEELEIQVPSIEDQEKIIKEMEYFDKLKEMYQTHITNTEIQIKERFEYHLNKCKNSTTPTNTNGEKMNKENNEETDESESSNESDKESEETEDLDESNSDDEKVKPIKNKKTITKTSKSSKLNNDNEPKLENVKSTKKIIKSVEDDDNIKDVIKTKTKSNKKNVKKIITEPKNNLSDKEDDLSDIEKEFEAMTKTDVKKVKKNKSTISK